MVSFGDSLSDIGTYKVGGVAQLGGGKWTVNAPDAKNWTELIAAQLQLSAPCAAQVGLPIGSALNPASLATSDVAGCTNYAQGSSRVTHPAGPSSDALWQIINTATGSSAAADASAQPRLTALPIAGQMAKVTAYTGSELVTVLAGANDVFMNMNVIAKAAENDGTAPKVGALLIAATAAGWNLRADWTTLQPTLAGVGATAIGAAQTTAQQELAASATVLASLIKTQVIGKGAKYVAVVNVPDIGITPFAVAGGPNTQALATGLVTLFNSTLATALAGTPGIVIVDAFADSHNQATEFNNPAIGLNNRYQLTNISTPVCDPTSVNNPLHGSSLTCTATASAIAGDTSHYLFADSVHPTPYGYKLLAQLTARSMLLAGWL